MRMPPIPPSAPFGIQDQHYGSKPDSRWLGHKVVGPDHTEVRTFRCIRRVRPGVPKEGERSWDDAEAFCDALNGGGTTGRCSPVCPSPGRRMRAQAYCDMLSAGGAARERAIREAGR